MLEGLKDPNRSMHVMFLLEGASDALSAANAILNADHKLMLFCAPETVNWSERVFIMKGYLGRNPQTSLLPVAVVMLRALQEAFPCP